MNRSHSTSRIPLHRYFMSAKRDSAVSDLMDDSSAGASILSSDFNTSPEPFEQTRSSISANGYNRESTDSVSIGQSMLPTIRRTRSNLKSTKSLENFALSELSTSSMITTSGYLFKLSTDAPAGTQQLWIKRYIVLTLDAKLHVFQTCTAKNATPLAVLSITECNVSFDPVESSHILSVKGTSVVNGVTMAKTWTLQCFDETECLHWSESIRHLFCPLSEEPRQSTDSMRYMPRILVARSSSCSLGGSGNGRREEREAEMKAMHEEYLRMQKLNFEKFRAGKNSGNV
ncbi:hypothetical protein BDR26DRAFT_877804 [Obelidium mucronatum]|nr:hypothetical protein BDR26DRAFT_877804 [Obelidium mucronatum]